MATAAIYTRLSQDRDGTKGSTERQEADCRALAKREALKVIEVFTDDDRSAYNGKSRPAFDRMLAELDRFDVLIYWKTDRLVRRTTQFFRVLEACQQANVRLVSVVDPVDTSTPIGQGVAGLLASVGEQESHNIGLRVKRLHEANALKGRPSGHRRAYGYELDGMTVVKSEAKMIREARDRILAGESMSSICNDWNRRGVMPTSAPAWRVSTFKRMVCGPRIAGLRQHHGEVVGAAAWPAIISTEDHEQVVRVLGDPRITRRGRPGRYLLSSLLRCGRCGGKLHAGVHGDGERLWTCQRVPGEDQRCGSLSVRAAPVDALVEKAILFRLDSPTLGRALRHGKSHKTKTDGKLVVDLEHRVTQLGLDHDAGLISRKEWLERRGPLLERLDAARAALVHGNGTGTLGAFEGVNVQRRWKTSTIEERRKVAALLIEHVTIAPSVQRGNTFDPDRVNIIWRV